MNPTLNPDEVLPLELLDLERDSFLRRGGYRTYDEWVAAGRHVVKGRTAKHRNSAGVALFHRNQTVVTPVQADWDGEDYESEVEFHWFDILDFGCRD